MQRWICVPAPAVIGGTISAVGSLTTGNLSAAIAWSFSVVGWVVVGYVLRENDRLTRRKTEGG